MDMQWFISDPVRLSVEGILKHKCSHSGQEQHCGRREFFKLREAGLAPGQSSNSAPVFSQKGHAGPIAILEPWKLLENRTAWGQATGDGLAEHVEFIDLRSQDRWPG
jgi:hypothetical protein